MYFMGFVEYIDFYLCSKNHWVSIYSMDWSLIDTYYSAPIIAFLSTFLYGHRLEIALKKCVVEKRKCPIGGIYYKTYFIIDNYKASDAYIQPEFRLTSI